LVNARAGLGLGRRIAPRLRRGRLRRDEPGTPALHAGTRNSKRGAGGGSHAAVRRQCYDGLGQGSSPFGARQLAPPDLNQEGATPAARPGHKAKVQPLTLLQRWHAAVGAVIAARSEYAAWYDALPEATRDGATGEALQAMIDLDLDELAAIVPPRGFGRD
jgi:hypothetical protein